MLNAAIAGLGMIGLSRVPGATARLLAARAVLAGLEDAGLDVSDLDGLLVCRSGGASEAELGLNLQRTLALPNLSLLQVGYAEGASSIALIQVAALAVSSGMARVVACVFADAPLAAGQTARDAFSRRKPANGVDSLRYAAGLFGGASLYALAARRYMHLYGASSEHFGAVAIAARAWATMNPLAVFRQPLTMEEYLASRLIVAPFRLYDCAMPVNGAIAVIVTAAERAADLKKPPIHILGMGQAHPGIPDQKGFERGLCVAGRAAKETALRMAGIELADIDICQFYDAFTYSTIASLEAYGFCAAGEGKDFVAGGAIGPGGTLPVNTGGGHLSGYYLQGMTPVSEAIVQARGEGGARQCGKHEIVLATNDGGRFDHHACLVLSHTRRSRR